MEDLLFKLIFADKIRQIPYPIAGISDSLSVRKMVADVGRRGGVLYFSYL
jgi:hypothetical protein